MLLQSASPFFLSFLALWYFPYGGGEAKSMEQSFLRQMAAYQTKPSMPKSEWFRVPYNTEFKLLYNDVACSILLPKQQQCFGCMEG